MRPASRSHGSRKLPASQFVRLSESDNDRLHDALDYRGGNMQDFLRTAITKEVAAVLKEKYEEEQYRERRRPGRPRAEHGGGSSIGDRIAAKRAERDHRRTPEPPAEQAPQPQVVVVAGNPTDELARFAKYIVTGDKPARAHRRQSALDILTATTPNIEDRKRIAKALDDKVAELDKSAEPADFFERVKRGFFQ